jgi:hypothetical protein
MVKMVPEKSEVKKAIQRDEISYEFTSLVFDIDYKHFSSASKTGRIYLKENLSLLLTQILR